MLDYTKSTIILISTLLTAASCTTRKQFGTGVTGPWLLDLPFAVIKSFEKPGPFGNWWKKEPLEDEKVFFSKALSGPLSPKDGIKDGDFVGWFCVILACESLTNLNSRVLLDHRFASDLNIRFGLSDPESIHTVSLFGDGIFTAKIGKPCSPTSLPGDLLRVYGTIAIKNKNVTVATAYARYWPRPTYELAPEQPMSNEEQTLRRLKSGWPELMHDASVPNRQTSIDGRVFTALLGVAKTSASEVRSRLAYSLGELGQIATASLLELRQAEQDTAVIKSLDFAIKRSKSEIGPYWKESAPEPYWKK